MSFIDLRRECERDGIGPLFWAALVECAGRVARRYPPDAYNHGEPWSDEAARDLAQEVALERLIGEHQLEYVLALATDDDSLRRLLAFQVRRVLAHRRSTTVVDRLVTRVRAASQSDPFEPTNMGSDLFIRLAGSVRRKPAFLSDVEVRRGAQRIASIPRLTSSPAALRESKVYTAAGLEELVRTLVAEFGGIALGDVRRILELTLTAWLPTLLREGEDDQLVASTPELEHERSQMTALIGSLVRDLDPIHRTVLLGKSQGTSDGELAARVGRSRPWLADRKIEVLALVEDRLMNQIPPELHTEATRALLDEIMILEDDA